MGFNRRKLEDQRASNRRPGTSGQAKRMPMRFLSDDRRRDRGVPGE
jgi:hypothetical protein